MLRHWAYSFRIGSGAEGTLQSIMPAHRFRSRLGCFVLFPRLRRSLTLGALGRTVSYWAGGSVTFGCGKRVAVFPELRKQGTGTLRKTCLVSLSREAGSSGILSETRSC
jgi:hypothetical protein